MYVVFSWVKKVAKGGLRVNDNHALTASIHNKKGTLGLYQTVGTACKAAATFIYDSSIQPCTDCDSFWFDDCALKKMHT